MTHAGSLIEFLTSAVERAEARAAQSCADSFPAQAGEGTILCVPASGPGLPLAPSPENTLPRRLSWVSDDEVNTALAEIEAAHERYR